MLPSERPAVGSINDASSPASRRARAFDQTGVHKRAQEEALSLIFCRRHQWLCAPEERRNHSNVLLSATRCQLLHACAGRPRFVGGS